ncbi:anthranilate synthase component II [Jeotgalibacillus proteolyticus]|uniref:Aminodeoxychorismate/anthranilate synthase component II n=1 Tax=Jeotgalibacillus proteolyticus TaxID=2082395 RepID=A0A2S5GFS9_9BACL|nr:aminodeoxychorismate/anthranilate synthase component II [Jeotgalibacillus proteolyticus]PPA71818.1 aminodeoxychorismate/anthranilate synthase component II [Jeotgalibacillus proteolyticus]
MILLIDNYDSFTYNLYQYLGEVDEVKVVRNDEITLGQIKECNPSLIVISPGPGHPAEAGICVEMIQKLGAEIPILGICLGHQAIGYAFGAEIDIADNIMHGKVSLIEHEAPDLFGSSLPIEVMRYHSLIVNRSTLPNELKEIATSLDDQEIMALKHQSFKVLGLQFHPESVGTNRGKELIRQSVHYLAE